MELDDMKQAWQQTPVNNKSNTDIMVLIHQKSSGPVAALKSVYRKQMILMAIIPFVLISTNIQDLDKVFTSIMFWSYVIFCIGVILFARYNYRAAVKMETMDDKVLTNLTHQIDLLEKRARWEITGLRCVLLYFIALTEVAPYFQHYRMLDHWHSLPAAVRFGSYTALFLVQYFLNARLKEKKVGRHLRYLRGLVAELK